jgi:hypothetical protein
LLYQEHFLSSEVEAAATGTQDTKQNSPEIIPDRAGYVIEGASTSRIEVEQDTNVSNSQTQESATGESCKSLRLVTYSVVHQ